MISTMRHRNGNRGVAIVEMVVVLPLLLLMLFVTAEIGRAFMRIEIEAFRMD